MNSAPSDPLASSRSIRTIVTQTPGDVTDAWCRRVLLQVLQSLEIQHGMRLPRRPITPDTIVVLDSGDPLLLPGDDDAPPSARLSDDLYALAGVVHYAITQEDPPAAPLAGRALPGFSPGLLQSIDRCRDSDPALRPHNAAMLRTLLRENEAPAEPDTTPASAEPVAQAAAPVPAHEAPEAASVLRTPSQSEDPAPSHTAARAAIRANVIERQSTRARWPWVLLLLAIVLGTWLAVRFFDAKHMLPGMRTSQQGTGAALPAEQIAGQAAPYQLQIRPWGTVFIDGLEVGVSPPLKEITLAPGRHTIRIQNPSFDAREETVDVQANTPGIVEVDFTEQETQP